MPKRELPRDVTDAKRLLHGCRHRLRSVLYRHQNLMLEDEMAKVEDAAALIQEVEQSIGNSDLLIDLLY